MPRRKLSARDVLDQAGIGKDFLLVRDHGGRNDFVLEDDVEVDLAGGNVFRVIPRCEAGPQSPCLEPAKRAFVCDDEWEVTLIGKQTGRSLKRLFNLPDDAVLLRDYESPHDQPIADDEVVEHRDGAVFKCKNRPVARETKILVNGREKVVQGKKVSHAQVVELAFGSVDSDKIYTVTYKHGPHSNPQGSMSQGDVVKIHCGMIFNATSTCKS